MWCQTQRGVLSEMYNSVVWNCILAIPRENATLWALRKVWTRISLSMPRRLTRIDTFQLLWIFCFRNHYSIPLSPSDGMGLPGSVCADCAGWSGSIRYAEAILLVFSRDNLYWVMSREDRLPYFTTREDIIQPALKRHIALQETVKHFVNVYVRRKSSVQLRQLGLFFKRSNVGFVGITPNDPF